MMAKYVNIQPRVLDSFSESWQEYTAGLPTPKIFLDWALISLISSALTRRVWIRGRASFPPLFPNLFVLLVGNPGVGKDIAINTVSSLLTEANNHLDRGFELHLGGESLSAKGLLDRLNSDNARQTLRFHDGKHEQFVEFNSIIACVPELGTMLPEYDTRLISILNELYNCKPKFQETIRGGAGHLEILNPHISLLLGSQPTTLCDILPEKSFSMGFTSRIIFIHAHTHARVPMVAEEKEENKEDLFTKLAQDLAAIVQLSGQFKISSGAAKLINHFHLVGADNTAIPGKRFEHYNTRRSLHAQKIALSISAMESDEKVITEAHWQRALQMLFEAEIEMPSIFEKVTSSRGFSEKLDDLPDKGGLITHAQVVVSLARRVPAHEIGHIVGQAIAAGVLQELPEHKPRTYRMNKHLL